MSAEQTLKPILIRADASARIGTGHVMRCLALAQAWQELGGHAILAAAVHVPLLDELLRNEGVAVVHFDSEPGSAEDARQTVALARKKDSAWLVTDGYHFGVDYQRYIKDSGLRLAYIDDAGYAQEYLADLVLNQNISAHEGLYVRRAPYTNLLLGLRYALLRREFWNYRVWNRTISAIGRNVLLTLGGSDPDNVTLKVVAALQHLDIPELRAKIVIGAANQYYESLRQLIVSSRGKFDLIVNTSEMPELMAWADLAVAAGGSTCWELALMGLPMVLLVLDDNQSAITSGLRNDGVAIDLGWHSLADDNEIVKALTALLSNPIRRQEMSNRARRLVDGFGALRVAAALKGE